MRTREGRHTAHYNPPVDRLINVGEVTTVIIGQPNYRPARVVMDDGEQCPFCGSAEANVSRVREHTRPPDRSALTVDHWYTITSQWNDCMVYECTDCHATRTILADEV